MITSIVVSIVIIITIWMYFEQKREQEKMYSVMKYLASSREWQVKKGNALYYPKLIIKSAENEIIVSAMVGRGMHGAQGSGGAIGIDGKLTYLTLKFNKEINFPEFRIHNKQRSLQSTIDSKFSRKKFDTGNDRFDKKYLVESKAEEAVKEILDTVVIANLLKYNYQNENFKFKNNTIGISIAGIAEKKSDFDMLISTAMLLASRLQKALKE